MSIADHYENLHVSRAATRDEIRVAYRRLARRYHPDSGVESSVAQMATINEAWSVLSDPARRSAYDAGLYGTNEADAVNRNAGESGRLVDAAGPAFQAGVGAHHGVGPARFPWRFMLILAALGIAFVIVNAALTDPPKPPPLDNILGVGSCVTLDVNGDVAESACDATSDGVVDSLLEPDGVCRQGTEVHRDRQGLGQVCVVIANSG